MSQAAAQSVLDGVRDLLPTFRDRADEAERLRVVPEASIKELEEVGFFRLLQPQRFDGLEADPVDVLHSSPRHRQRVRLDRLGLQRGRRAPVAGGAVRGRGAAGGLGRGHQHAAELVVRADGQGHGDRGRLHAVGQVELPLRLRPLHVGAARRAGVQRGRQRRRLQDVHGPAQGLHDQRRLAHDRPVAAPAPTTSSSRTCSSPRRSRSVDGRDRPVQGPGPGAEHLRPLQAAVPLDLHRHHHHADHRHGDGRLRRARRDAAEAHPRGVPRREGVARPVRRRPDRQGLAARSTRPGRCWSTTSARSRTTSPRASRSRSRPGSRSAATRCSAPSAPSTRSTRCSRPPAAARSPRARYCSGPGATPTPAGCTPPTTPSGRCRCTAPTSSATRSTPGCTDG